jgi:CRP/FNR family transcriptional regulator
MKNSPPGPADEKRQALTASVMFSGLSEQIISKIAEITQKKEFGRGGTIFLEGKLCSGFFMVVQGRVKLFKMALNGKEQILYILGPGEPFGIVPVFHQEAFPANAAAMTASTTLFFPKKEFLELTAAYPELMLSIMSKLCHRMRCFAAQIENLSLKDMPKRLAAHLLYLQEEQGGANQVLIDIPKKQLANLLGSSPETLSRIFAEMSAAGLIRVEGSTIQLLDLAGLRCQAE